LHNTTPFFETDLTIEIIEFDSESKIKILRLASKCPHGTWCRSKVSNHQFRGGVVTDLGVCSFHLQTRVDFIHIPTTLLSMVDASVGGKNGVDLGNLKPNRSYKCAHYGTN
jgi:3-dehydroquinate synthase